MARPNGYACLTAMTALALAACSEPQQQGAPGASAEAPEPWRHGIVEAKGDAAVHFMPAAGGFLERRGIEVEMVEFQAGTTAARALLAGEVDSIEGNPVLALAAMHQGAPIKFIGCHWPVMTYSLFATPDIESIADLRGKAVGVSAPGSLPDLFAREALAAGGIGGNEVTYANAGGSANRFQAVAAGIVSASASSSEFEIEAIPRGIKVLMRGAEATPNFLKICTMTTTDKIATRRDTMVRYLAGSMEGYQYALDNRDEAIRVAQEWAHLGEHDETAAFVFDEAIRYNAVTPNMEIPMDKLQWTDDMMVRHGALPQSMDVSAFVDDTVRQEALELLGQ